MRWFNLNTVKLRDYGKMNSYFRNIVILQIVLPFQSCNRESPDKLEHSIKKDSAFGFVKYNMPDKHLLYESVYLKIGVGFKISLS